MQTEIFALGAFWLGLVVVTAGVASRREIGFEEFIVADRDVGVSVGALTILATWTAPPAVLISSQLAFDLGMTGLFWFVVPNVLALVAFGIIASRISKQIPDGLTMTEVFERESDALYLTGSVFIFSKEFITVIFSVVGGSAFLTFFSDLSRLSAIFLMLAIILSYSIISGLSASIVTDVIQIVVLGVLLVVYVPWTIGAGDGFATVAAAVSIADITGIFGLSGLTLGFILLVNQITSTITSQSLWQRTYAVSDRADRSFFIAALLFGFIPLSTAFLGLMASASGLPVENSLLAGFHAISEAVPLPATIVVFLILVAALLSSADSALVAAASILAIDIVDRLLDRDTNQVTVMRASMVAISLVVGLLALTPLSFFDWFLLNAPIGVVLTVPVLAFLYSDGDLDTRKTVYTMLTTAILVMPTYVYASLVSNNSLRAITLAVGLAMTIVGMYTSRWDSRNGGTASG